MKRFFWLIFIILIINQVFVSKTLAVDCKTERCATCDLCGYCWQITPTPPARNPPSNWESCRACLYPAANSTPESNETLKITDTTTNMPPTPWPGHWYSMIGCINTNLTDFTQPGAAASLVKTLLDLIFKTAGGIAFLYLIYGAFLILTSQADPEKLSQGKRVIYGAVVGLLFSLLSVFMVNFIANNVLKVPFEP